MITGIALIGCGFVSDYYLATLNAHPELRIVGVYDNNNMRLNQFSSYYNLHKYETLEQLLDDNSSSIVLNLTDPRSHYVISKRCLESGKNVYSEKPMAMDFDQAVDLIETAKKNQLIIFCAPCSVLSRAAKTVSFAVKKKLCGDVKLVYAELDDGMVHKMAYKKWVSTSGAPWPYRDEFEVGCTLEHSGYNLSWLMEIFGPVKSVTAFSDCLFPEKITNEISLQPPDSPDVSIGILKFENGVVARLTNTIVANRDHSIRFFGENGIISIKDCWDNNCKVFVQNFIHFRRKTFLSPFKRQVKLPGIGRWKTVNRGNTKMDFLLGVRALADVIHYGEKGILSANFSLHVNEVALALQYAGVNGKTYFTKSRF